MPRSTIFNKRKGKRSQTLINYYKNKARNILNYIKLDHQYVKVQDSNDSSKQCMNNNNPIIINKEPNTIVKVKTIEPDSELMCKDNNWINRLVPFATCETRRNDRKTVDDKQLLLYRNSIALDHQYAKVQDSNDSSKKCMNSNNSIIINKEPNTIVNVEMVETDAELICKDNNWINRNFIELDHQYAKVQNSNVSSEQCMINSIITNKEPNTVIKMETVETDSELIHEDFNWINSPTNPCVASEEIYDLSFISHEENESTNNACDLSEEVREINFVSCEEYKSIDSLKLEIEIAKQEPAVLINGYRIVDLQYVLNWALRLQVEHKQHCTVGTFEIVNEELIGLMSAITFQCDSCRQKIIRYTENPKTLNLN